ncbi:serine/threonine-protein kinase [Actinophytocola sp.]|uniref:serine/threonine protein kinase n=1 Tax=Actinophytocola sp. TaxID=1872138 RepID=UPI002ED1AC16
MTAAPPPEIPGYRFVRHVGSGGYADVYQYLELRLTRPVAVKVLKDGLGEQVRRQFTDEANAIALLGDHPHIVTVYTAAVTPDGRPYLVMSYCPGENYAQRARRRQFTVNEVLTVGIQLASAVAAAHQASILHRDIKPANILTDQWGQPRLADFGIAGRMASEQTTDEVAMSVPWSPPEVVRGGTAGVLSDVYSLGATLWHLLVGHSPFWVPNGDTIEAMIERIVAMPLPPLGRQEVPGELEEILRRALAPHASNRQRTASALGSELQELKRRRGLDHDEVEFRTSLPTAPTPVSPVQEPEHGATQVRPRRPPDRRPAPEPPAATVLPGHTVAREIPRDEAPVAQTQHRPRDPEPVESPPRKRWPVFALAGVLAAVVGFGALMFANDPTGTETDDNAQVDDPGGAMQDAGLPGADSPPGMPAITATRTGDGSVRFTWNYSAQLATDTFAWQTPDGGQHGTADSAELVLPGTAGTELCVQVKVVRADGSHGATDWSDPGCAG